MLFCRFACASCSNFDLCSACERIEPPLSSPDGRHSPNHIFLKIRTPIAEQVFEAAVTRARDLTQGGSTSPQRRRNSPVSYDRLISPPDQRDDQATYPPRPNNVHHSVSGPPSGLPPSRQLQRYSSWQGPPGFHNNHDRSNVPLEDDAISDNVVCQGCDKVIRECRWICAQCGPRYNLASQHTLEGQ